MSLAAQALMWAGVYVAMVLAPIALVMLPPLPSARGFWYEFAIGLGFVGLAMMAAQFALTARFRWIAGRIGMDSMLHFHRQAGIIGFLFVMAHPIVLILADRRALAFFDPTVNAPRALALTFAIVALLCIVGLSVWRKSLKIPYQWWRLSHGVLAAGVILVGLAHTLMVGRYVSVIWKQGLWVVLIGAALLLLVQMRIIKPLMAARRPWRVTAVRKEVERVWTLTLAPDGQNGLSFAAGQCVWLSLGDSPFTLESHPFTIASSEEAPQQVDLTIKELGDWTNSIGETAVGTRAILEGPYGAFMLAQPPLQPPRESGSKPQRLVMIAGGIGITPFMSMLRTMRDRNDQRPVVLLYAGASLDRLAFRDELESLKGILSLDVVYVLENPPATWTGESGFITKDMLARQAGPSPAAETTYYVCGPEPMMDAVEQALLDLDIALEHILSERFEIA